MIEQSRKDLSVGRPKTLALIGRGLFVLALGIAASLTGAQSAHATTGINSEINYQARLLNAAGATVPDGNYNIEFTIYSGGNGCVGGGTSPCSGSALWTEDWLNNNSQGITVTNGYFSVMLGAGSDSVALSTLNFNQYPLWLSINIGNTNGTCATFSVCSGDGEMLPFTQFAAAPYAFDAAQVGGINASSLVVLSPGSPQSGNLSVTGTITSGSTLQATAATLTAANALTLGSITDAASILFQDGTANNYKVTLTTPALANSYTLNWATSGATGSQCLQSTSGSTSTTTALQWGSCGSSTLQSAYNNSSAPATITTADNKDLKVVLANTTTDSNFLVDIATGSTGKFAIQDNGTDVLATTSAGQLALSVQGSTGGLLLGGDATLYRSGSNALTTGSGLTAAGLLTGSAGLTVTGGGANINASGSGATNLGSTGSGGAVAIQSASTIDLTSGTTLGLTSTGANNINITPGGASNTGVLVQPTTDSTAAFQIQSNTSSLNLFTADSLDDAIIIGSPTTDTTQILLQLDSFSTLADTATCSTTTNQGALYYNTSSNAVRACVNGSWQDLVSTAGLSQLLFGVVPNSGNNPGDLIGASATSTTTTGGPCKVTWSSGTSVNVEPCLAYSGGREVNVGHGSVTNVPIGTIAANNFEDICLDSSGVPAVAGSVSATDGLQASGNLDNTNATTLGQPLLCLATIKAGSANALGRIYDIRTFTTTTKTYGTVASATQILGGVIMVSTAGLVKLPTATTSPILGVIVAATGAAGTAGTPNIMYATAGPQWIKASGLTQGDFIVPATTGYTTASVTTGADGYDQLGIAQAATFATACSVATFASTSNCQESDFTNLNIH